MIARYLQDGTPVMDFAATEALAKTKASSVLRHAITDCHAAIAANPDNVKCGYYSDEIHVYAAELRARQGAESMPGHPRNHPDGFWGMSDEEYRAYKRRGGARQMTVEDGRACIGTIILDDEGLPIRMQGTPDEVEAFLHSIAVDRM